MDGQKDGAVESVDPYIHKYLGTQRLAGYRNAVGGDSQVGVQLYVWNIRASGAVFEVIGIVEVVLRNAIVDELTLLDQEMEMEWFEYLEPLLSEKALSVFETAKERATSKAGAMSPTQLITELSFGFWTYLFSRRYDMSLWRVGLSHRFSSISSVKRSDVYNAMVSLKDLRNRIAHHEPIFRRDLSEDTSRMYELISWIDIDLVRWVQDQSRIEQYFKCPWVVTPYEA